MPPIVALAVTVGVVLLAAAVGLVLRTTTGRAHRTPATSGETYPAGSLPDWTGSRPPRRSSSSPRSTAPSARPPAACSPA